MKIAAEVLLFEGGTFSRTICAEHARVLMQRGAIAKGSRTTVKAIIIPVGVVREEILRGLRLPKEKPYSHCYETPTNPRGCWELRRLAC